MGRRLIVQFKVLQNPVRCCKVLGRMISEK
jgi:hypothetical protein